MSDEERPHSISAELRVFAETTSLVGLAHVVGERFRWAKLLWAVAFVGASCAAVYQVATLIQKYRR